MADEPLSFMARLKRHHVFRVATVYAVASWVLIQLGNSIFPDFGWPRESVLILIVALLLGFPVAMSLGWMLIPPSKDNPAKYSHWQKWRWRLGSGLSLLIIMLVTISGGLLWHANARYFKTETVVAPKSQASLAEPESGEILPNSIAVLPFANLSGDPANQYFSDGISEEILVTLGQVPGLNVIGRTSSFQFRGSDVDPSTIRRSLRVRNILSGSIQRAGDEVRITAELVDTMTGVQLWSQHYDRKFTNVFSIEDDISRSIASTLRLKLAEGEAGFPLANETKNPEAHRLYLVGLEKLEARSPALRDALSAFQRAIKLDPHYAQAWGALAVTEIVRPDYEIAPLEEVLPRAERAAKRAFALNPNVTSAYVALGIVNTVRWQWTEADQAFRHALILAPSDAETINQYAQFLWTVGQLQAALVEIERAQRVNPLSAVISMVHAHILFALRHYQDSIGQIQDTLSAHPDFALAHSIAAVIYINRHRYADAELQIQTAATLYGKNPEARILLVRGMADPSLRAAAIHSLEIPQANSDLRSDPISYAGYFTVLGDKKRALEVLEDYAIHRNSMNPQFIWDPSFDAISADPRFKNLIRKMGLPYIPKQIYLE